MTDFHTINLTQYDTVAEQHGDGVAYREDKDLLAKLLTFDAPPSAEFIQQRAEALAILAQSQIDKLGIPRGESETRVNDWPQAMIGGAPYLMASLERELVYRRIAPVYAFSHRASIEEVLADGTVKKSSAFRHICLVGVPIP